MIAAAEESEAGHGASSQRYTAEFKQKAVELFERIEVACSGARIYSALGYLSPAEFEKSGITIGRTDLGVFGPVTVSTPRRLWYDLLMCNRELKLSTQPCQPSNRRRLWQWPMKPTLRHAGNHSGRLVQSNRLRPESTLIAGRPSSHP